MTKRRDDREFFVILEKEKEYYTVKEAASVLHVSPVSIQNYITNGVIEAEIINGRRMISRDALCQRLAQLNKQCVYGFNFEEVNV